MFAFYHTAGDTPAAVDAALPSLLAKAVAAGHRLAIICPTPERLHRLDESLWTFSQESFLPHAPLEDALPNASRHPVVLLTSEEAAAAPAHLAGRTPVLLAGAESALPNLPQAERTLYLFHNHPDATANARTFYKSLKTSGQPLAYWQQTPQGKWEQKQASK